VKVVVDGIPIDNFEEFEIYCDKSSDVDLVNTWKKVFPKFFGRIENIKVLPKLNDTFRKTNPSVAALIEYDRPDLIITYHGKPILIVEITIHGYTGDNPLQRFPRILKAATLGVPIIYVTPFARARIDESLATDKQTSLRRVSSRVFEGCAKLMDLFKVPVVAVDWAVDAKGIPRALRTSQDIQDICGNLVILIEHICRNHSQEIYHKRDIHYCPVIDEYVSATRKQATISNVLESEIRIEGQSYTDILGIIKNYSTIIDIMGEDYFFKGKDQKLIALLCILAGRIRQMETKEGRIMPIPASFGQIRKLLPIEFKKKNWLILYSGYEWRSEPNAGVIANTDIIMCRTGCTPKDRSQLLAVMWPRVFLNKKAHLRNDLLLDIQNTCAGKDDTQLAHLLAKKREQRKTGGTGNSLSYGTKKIGVWNEATTVARVYRSLCDLIILNDAILLGDHWKEKQNV
jgi:hypothetical protein